MWRWKGKCTCSMHQKFLPLERGKYWRKLLLRYEDLKYCKSVFFCLRSMDYSQGLSKRRIRKSALFSRGLQPHGKDPDSIQNSLEGQRLRQPISVYKSGRPYSEQRSSNQVSCRGGPRDNEANREIICLWENTSWVSLFNSSIVGAAKIYAVCQYVSVWSLGRQKQLLSRQDSVGWTKCEYIVPE